MIFYIFFREIKEILNVVMVMLAILFMAANLMIKISYYFILEQDGLVWLILDPSPTALNFILRYVKIHNIIS